MLGKRFLGRGSESSASEANGNCFVKKPQIFEKSRLGWVENQNTPPPKRRGISLIWERVAKHHSDSPVGLSRPCESTMPSAYCCTFAAARVILKDVRAEVVFIREVHVALRARNYSNTPIHKQSHPHAPKPHSSDHQVTYIRTPTP